METSKARRKKYLRVAGFALAIVMGSSLCFSAWAQEAPAEVAIPSSLPQVVEGTTKSGQESQLVTPKEDEALDARTSATTEESITTEVSSDAVRRAGNKEIENVTEPQPESLVLPEFYVMQEAQVLDLASPQGNPGHWSVDTGAGSITIEGAGPYRVENSTSDYHLVIGANTTLILSNATVTQASVAPVQVQSGHTLSLVLEGNNTVSTTSDAMPSVYVPAGAALHISGAGSLAATGAAGIGAVMENTGSITIAGGTVNAMGMRYNGIGGDNANITITGGTISAITEEQEGMVGIGGGFTGTATIAITGGNIYAKAGLRGISNAAIGSATAYDSSLNVLAGNANITITGGIIEAIGGYDAAAIGSSYQGNATISILGGTLKLTGGHNGVSIGAASGECEITIAETNGPVNIEANADEDGHSGCIGSSGEGSIAQINIAGGTIVVSGYDGAAGIGSGGGGVANVIITGGDITAQGGFFGAGIGNGTDSSDTTITTVEISGGVIRATGGYYAPGIGSGFGNSANVTITDGEITANSSNPGGAGIGAGAEGGAYVVITGGTIKATGCIGGAGIGGGQGSGNNEEKPVTVEISGGTVNAIGGEDISGMSFAMYGSGIGCGYSGNVTVTITGGEVTARGSGWNAGIGCGTSGNAVVTITGGKVVAYGNSMEVSEAMESGSSGINANEVTIAGVAEVTSYGGPGNNYGGAGITTGSDSALVNKLTLDDNAHFIAVGGLAVGEIEEGQDHENGNGIYYYYYDIIEETYPGEGRQVFHLGANIKLEAYAKDAQAIHTLMDISGDGYVQNNFYNPATLGDVTGFIATAGNTNARTATQQEIITLPAGYTAFAVMSSAQGLVYDINEEIPRPLLVSSVTTAAIPGRQGNIDAYELVLAPYDTVQFLAGEAVGIATNMPHTQYVRKSNTGNYLLPQEVPAFPHYTFLGWLSNDGTGTLYPARSAYKPLSSDVTFNAQWAFNQYNVVFDGNGATAGSMENQTAGYGAQINLNKNNFTRTGYDFVGWNTDKNALSGLYGDEGDYTQTEDADVTLYAIWVAKGYGVSFNANNGSGEMAPLAIKYGETKLLPKNTFTRTGYDFVGWNTDENALSGIYADEGDYTQTGENDVTLYAIWVAKGYGVSFNANDGNGEMAPLAIQYGETKLLPKNTFTRAGYNFVGWAKAASAQTAEYANEGSYRHESEDNVILYAVWETASYTLSFDTQGGTPKPEAQTLKYGAKAVAPAVPGKDGYTFLGWYDAASGGNRWDFEKDTMPNKDITLYAQWKSNSPVSSQQTAGGGTTAPKTGDGENVALWGVLAAVAAAGTAALLLWRKKQGKPKV